MNSPGIPAKKAGLRIAITWTIVALAYVVALSFYKSTLMDGVAREAVASLKTRHARVSSVFQASYYFFYDDQFLPGVQKELSEETAPVLKRIQVLAAPGGGVLFDSKDPKKPDQQQGAPASAPAAVTARLSASEPSIFTEGFSVLVLMPGAQYGVLYTVDATPVRNLVAVWFVSGLLLAALAHWMLSRSLTGRITRAGARAWSGFWRLRVKFLSAIVLINVVTAAILFFTLTGLQTREQSERIERDSMLFSQFSTSQVIGNFTNYYYFYYSDRFIPEIKRIIASNENLTSLRIISKRTGGVLFDSEQSETPPREGGLDAVKAELGPELEEQLKSRDLASQLYERDGERRLRVVSTFRNESQDAIFWVEYVFGFQTLARGIQAIRRQILIDLVPSIALGLLIAAVFAQLLISPIRRLVAALGRVTAGDYEATVDVRRKDEVGDLVAAFNSMTEELRKKKELRKYLSDSTYRQVMRAPDAPGGARMGGSRVVATVLFSDIRGFVRHCESLEAEEVTAMLNEYFSEMVEVIHKHGGEIDKFIGDALLAVFYAVDDSRVIAPSGGQGSSGAASALQALHCSLEMRDRLRDFNQKRVAAGKAAIETGVGITHGELISGPIGAKDRMDFTVIGDVVNLASRIEKLSKQGTHTRVVFSHQVEEKVRGLLDYVAMPGSEIQGKEEAVQVYELVGVRDVVQLIGNLSSQDLALRRRSVELLGHSRNERADGEILRALGDADEGTRLQAVLAVSKRGSGGFDALISRFGRESSERVLSALITATGKLSAGASEERVGRLIDTLQPFLESPNERVLANAIEALGQARSARCTDLILPKLTSRNNRVKANAAMALFAAGRIEVIDTLKPMLMHSDALMRSSAAFAIGELTLIAEQEQLMEQWKARGPTLKLFLAELQQCVPMLVSALRDPEPMVRRQAIVALGKIKDKSAVLPMIDMLGPESGARELMQDISEALRSIGSHRLVREVIARLSQGG